jgi:hypothetical protein
MMSKPWSSGIATITLFTMFALGLAAPTPGEMPDWFVDKDVCYMEYCNYYEDLQRDLCCPDGAQKTEGANHVMYCFGEERLSCNVANSEHVRACKSNAKSVGVDEGRIKRHIFSLDCGGVDKALSWPKWLPDRAECWIEYCNQYEDLQHSFCCPTGSVTVPSQTLAWTNGRYCSETSSCVATHTQQVRDCKQSAISNPGRLDRHKFSGDCGGIAKVGLPEWLVDKDTCWAEYCNYYPDLQKAFCCPPNAKMETLDNGEKYCSHESPTCYTDHASACKNHATTNGIYEGRLSKYAFSPMCGGTGKINMDEQYVAAPRVSKFQVAMGFIFCCLVVFAVGKLYLRCTSNNSKDCSWFEAALGSYPSTIGGHRNQCQYHDMTTPPNF